MRSTFLPSLAVIVAVLALGPAGAEAQSPPPPCPVAALAPPQPAGVEQTIHVGQHRPCPPPNRTQSDFDVTIDWGDGTSSPAPYRPGDNAWFIYGTHTFQQPGTYAVVATVVDRISGERLEVRRDVVIPPPPQPCPLAALAPPQIEGKAQHIIVGQPSPCPPPRRTPANFDVTIAWGDGTTSPAPFAPADNAWFIQGNHAYRRAGTYGLVATVTDRLTGQATVMRREITVPNAPLSARPTKRPRFSSKRAVRRVVARFADGNVLAAPTDHRASVSWGDGSRTAGKVFKTARGTFAVHARHRYRTRGRKRVVVTVEDDRGATLRMVRSVVSR